MNTTSILAKTIFLKSHPEAQDALNPHLPILHTPIKEYIIGTLVKEISLNLSNRDLAAKANQAARLLVETSSKMLLHGSESDDIDDLCPPYFRIPLPRPPH